MPPWPSETQPAAQRTAAQLALPPPLALGRLARSGPLPNAWSAPLRATHRSSRAHPSASPAPRARRAHAHARPTPFSLTARARLAGSSSPLLSFSSAPAEPDLPAGDLARALNDPHAETPGAPLNAPRDPLRPYPHASAAQTLAHRPALPRPAPLLCSAVDSPHRRILAPAKPRRSFISAPENYTRPAPTTPAREAIEFAPLAAGGEPVRRRKSAPLVPLRAR
jgi:hypothetical protein